MANPIDKYLVIDVLKKDVDEAHKQAKLDAEDFLAEARDNMGVTGLTPPMFDGCGEFKYAATKAKKHVEFNLCDESELEVWVAGNSVTVAAFLAENVERFGKWCQDATGEVPDGISRVECDIPAGFGAPKFYRVDADKVKEIASGNGNFFEGANRLLLGDGDE